MAVRTRARRRSNRLRGALRTIRKCRLQCSQANQRSARAKAPHRAAVYITSIQNRALQPLVQNLDKMEAAPFLDIVPPFLAAQHSLVSEIQAFLGIRQALPTLSMVWCQASHTKIKHSRVQGRRHTREGRIRHQEQAHRTWKAPKLWWEIFKFTRKQSQRTYPAAMATSKCRADPTTATSSMLTKTIAVRQPLQVLQRN